MPQYDPPMPRLFTLSFASGASASGWVKLGSLGIANLRFPTGFQGTTVRLQAALPDANGDADADTAVACTDAAGSPVAVAITAPGVACLPPDGIRGLSFVRLVAYTGGSVQTQSAARDVRAYCTQGVS